MFECKGLGIYIHIPFCIRKCNYCDFCSFTERDKNIMYAYTDELCSRIKKFGEEHRICADTVYFGGGTPTLLPQDCFSKILDTLRYSFQIDENAEISVECNPATINEEGLVAIRSMGVNRLSIGLQSANDTELKELGRLHSFVEFCHTFNAARRAGFSNISVDLMYGIPKQTVSSFKQTLESVCELSPEHISAYGLKIERGTAFYDNRKLLELPCEDEEYEMYCLCEKILRDHGYQRYEISNFAKDGYISRHNIHYWLLDEYVGFGVAAHSFFAGERYGNSRDIDAFLQGLEEGLSMSEYQKISGRSFKTDFPQTDKYIAQGFLIEREGRISFSTKGFFVSNAILSDMLDFEE